MDIKPPSHALVDCHMFQYMVCNNDVIAVSEFLYFGANPDLEDPSNSATPLWIIIKKMADIVRYPGGPFILAAESLDDPAPIAIPTQPPRKTS